MPKLEQIRLFKLRDFCNCVLLWALTRFEVYGTQLDKCDVRQHLNQTLMTVVELFADVARSLSIKSEQNTSEC